jgi:hypothetical protein
MADIDTLLPARACREMSEFVAFDLPAIPPLPKMGVRSIERIGRLCGFRIDVGSAQTTKSSHVCPSVGNNTNANILC